MNAYKTEYQQRAEQTRSRRSYPTPAQLAAGRKLINEGVAALTVEDLEQLYTHPYMAASQRAWFAELAAKL